MKTDALPTVHIRNRHARLRRRTSTPTLDEPPDLSTMVVIEMQEADSSSPIEQTNQLSELFIWLRNGHDPSEYIEEFRGQEDALAKIACGVHGLVPALGDDACIAGTIFKISAQDLAPRLELNMLCCVGYLLELWSSEKESIAKRLCVDLVHGTVTISKTWRV